MNFNENISSTLTIDDYVVYKGSGICRYAGKEKRCFDGKTSVDYFKFVPVGSASSSFYIPIDKVEGKIRKLLTKDELLIIIDNLNVEQVDFSSNSRERKLEFDDILRGDNYTDMLRMIYAIYKHSEEIKQSGKRMSVADERVFRSAESMLYPEFAVVLGIEPNEVAGFIADRLETASI